MSGKATKAYEATLKAVRLAALVGTVLSASTASAATLKDQVVVSDAMIHLSDLFDDVGQKGDAVVMEAPAPGKSDQVSAYELDRIAKEYKLDWKRPPFLKRIQVSREGVPFKLDDLTSRILEEAADQGVNEDNVQVRLFGRKSGLYLPAGASLQDITFESFDLSASKTRFSAIALIPTGTGAPVRLNFGGVIEEMRDVPMFTRIVSPGEVIRKSDITWGKMPARRVNSRTVLSVEDLVGQTVRRPEQPGIMIMDNDITTPIVIGKGSIITMMIRSGSMVLSTNGRALDDGGAGETIRVMNTKSKQTVDARVVKAGLAEVISSNSLNLAAR